MARRIRLPQEHMQARLITAVRWRRQLQRSPQYWDGADDGSRTARGRRPRRTRRSIATRWNWIRCRKCKWRRRYCAFRKRNAVGPAPWTRSRGALRRCRFRRARWPWQCTRRWFRRARWSWQRCRKRCWCGHAAWRGWRPCFGNRWRRRRRGSAVAMQAAQPEGHEPMVQ